MVDFVQSAAEGVVADGEVVVLMLISRLGLCGTISGANTRISSASIPGSEERVFAVVVVLFSFTRERATQ